MLQKVDWRLFFWNTLICRLPWHTVDCSDWQLERSISFFSWNFQLCVHLEMSQDVYWRISLETHYFKAGPGTLPISQTGNQSLAIIILWIPLGSCLFGHASKHVLMNDLLWPVTVMRVMTHHWFLRLFAQVKQLCSLWVVECLHGPSPAMALDYFFYFNFGCKIYVI